jgi:HTH-type transcriptional regulator / antitoxin HigA
MTLTFNRERYKDLLSEYQPKLIKTETENEQALVMVEKLMNLTNRTPEQQELYELLIVLVEKFEREFYQPERRNNQISMLLFLMEQRDMQSADLVDIFGSISVAEDVIAGRVQIDQSISEALGRLFHVDATLFV